LQEAKLSEARLYCMSLLFAELFWRAI